MPKKYPPPASFRLRENPVRHVQPFRRDVPRILGEHNPIRRNGGKPVPILSTPNRIEFVHTRYIEPFEQCPALTQAH
jgi:hypothetical protein